METVNSDAAIAQARSVLHYYSAVYGDARLLETALEARSHPDTVEALFRSAADAADKYEKANDHREALYRAADAAEKVREERHTCRPLFDRRL